MVPRQSMGLCSAREHAFRLNRRRKHRLYRLPRHKFPKRGSSQPVHGAEDSLLLSYTARSYRYAAVHRHSCCCESDGGISSHSRHAAEHFYAQECKWYLTVFQFTAATRLNTAIFHKFFTIFYTFSPNPPHLFSILPIIPLQQITFLSQFCSLSQCESPSKFMFTWYSHRHFSRVALILSNNIYKTS